MTKENMRLEYFVLLIIMLVKVGSLDKRKDEARVFGKL
jgi:hypothetical protein